MVSGRSAAGPAPPGQTPESGIGFGLQNVVNNFVSGLILLYERPVQKSDIVEVGSLLGDVRRIGIRSSTVRTYDGAR